MAIHYHIESNDFQGMGFNALANAPLVVKGYLFTLQRSAHTKCNCFQGIPFSVFRPHAEAYGDFPMHYKALEHLLGQALPDSFTVQRHSYGWARRSALCIA